MAIFRRASLASLLMFLVGCDSPANSPAEEALVRCEAAGSAYAATKAEAERVEETLSTERSTLEAKMRAETDSGAVELASTLDALRTALQEAEARYASADRHAADLRSIENDIIGTVLRSRRWAAGTYKGPNRALYDDALRATRDALGKVHPAERDTNLVETVVSEVTNYASAEATWHRLREEMSPIRQNIYAGERQLEEAQRKRETDLAARLEEAMFGRYEELRSLQQRLNLDEEFARDAIRESNAVREPGGPICSWQFADQ